MAELPKLPKKILVISSYAPPAISGGALYLFRILANFNPDSYCFFTSHNNFKENIMDSAYRLPCRYYFYDQPSDKKSGHSRLLTLLKKPFRIFTVIRQARAIIQRENIEVLVGVTDHGRMFMLTYILSRVTGIPYCPWMVDLYRDNNFPNPWKTIARYFEPILLKRSALILTSSHGVEDYLRLQYPRLNKFQTINIGGFDDGSDIIKIKPNDNSEITILFSGSIYWAHESAIDEVIKACQELPDFRIKMLFYVPNRTDAFLEKYSEIPNIEIRSAKRLEMLLALREADILLIPFSWQTRSNAVINTAVPTKLIDYLLAGKPILIYAPKESYISKYGREKEFACVVDEQSAKEIQSAIRKIISNKEYASRLVRNARKTFFENHDIRINSQVLSDSLLRLQ